MDLSVVLLLLLLLLIIFLIWFTDPFDESKVKTEYHDSAGFDGAGLVAQRYSTALRQRPQHGFESTAQLPRPNAAGAGHIRHGSREQIPRGGRGGVTRDTPPLPPQVYHDIPPTAPDHAPIRASPAPAAIPPPQPADNMSNVQTQPMGGLRRSKPLVSFDNASPWLRARTRSNSFEPEIPAEKEQAPVPKIAPANVCNVDSIIETSRSGLQRDTSHMQLLDLKDIDLQCIIGGGAFGQVWKGSWNGTPVAVKTIPMLSVVQPQLDVGGRCSGESAPVHGHDIALLQAFEDEVHIFADLRHPNICLFIGACLTMPTRAIITELVPRGSLWEALRTPGLFDKSSQGSYFWPWWVVRRIVDGTCRGLIYLHTHSPPIIHRDLKSANVLLDESFNPKICDFGLARLKDLNNVMTANVGTAQWMSPEVIKGLKYSEKADIYSLAIVAWETMTGKCPFEGMSQLEVVVAVSQSNKRPTVPDFCEPAICRLLVQCWQENPSERPSAKEALAVLNATHGP